MKPDTREHRIKLLLYATLGLVVIAWVATSGLVWWMNADHMESELMTQTAPNSSSVDLGSTPGLIEEGMDVESGFIAEGNYLLVKQNCTGCHSSKLVLQNRATREGWAEMIRWMQETQQLWDLGDAEEPILDYLATYYAPEIQGRRANLVVDEWYEIE